MEHPRKRRILQIKKRYRREQGYPSDIETDDENESDTGSAFWKERSTKQTKLTHYFTSCELTKTTKQSKLLE